MSARGGQAQPSKILLLLSLFIILCTVSGTNCTESCRILSTTIRNSSSISPVDVFFMASNFQNRAYIRRGLFWLVPLMASLHSSADEVRIHFFVDDDIDKHDLSEAARFYFFHDIQSYLNDSKAFLDRYRPFHTHHAAYLEAEYDSFCFFRWIIFSREVKVWNSRRDRVPIERVLALDLDVLMTVSPARFFNNVFNAVSLTDGLSFVSVALGAVVALTTEGLADLSDYIFGF